MLLCRKLPRFETPVLPGVKEPESASDEQPKHRMFPCRSLRESLKSHLCSASPFHTRGKVTFVMLSLAWRNGRVTTQIDTVSVETAQPKSSCRRDLYTFAAPDIKALPRSRPNRCSLRRNRPTGMMNRWSGTSRRSRPGRWWMWGRASSRQVQPGRPQTGARLSWTLTLNANYRKPAGLQPSARL